LVLRRHRKSSMRRVLLVIASMLALLTGQAHAQACPSGTSDAAVPRERVGPYHKHLASRLAEIQRQAKTPADVILLGDSILARWPADQLAATFPGRRVLDAALGGDRTQNVLWRLRNTDWSAQRPRAVVLLIGTNNTANFSACDIGAGVRRIAQDVHGRFPAARLYVISLLPRGPNMLDRDDLIRKANRLIAVGQTQGMYRFIDVHDAFACGKRTPCELMLGRNQVHLSPRGFALLGRLVRAQVTL
jgi:platelet-activating factor acetylhydrolase IB subunit beta/gamma